MRLHLLKKRGNVPHLTLHEALWKLTVDDLRYRLKFLAPESKVTRKAEFIDGIKAALAGDGLFAAFNELDKTGRLAVIEAVDAFDFRHHPVRFRAKYGSDAEFFVKEAGRWSSSSYQSPKNATRLNIFFYHDGTRSSPVIPNDLAASLQTLLPAPTKVEVPVISEPTEKIGRWIRRTEPEALAELGALLRLANMGQFGFGEKTGIPSKKSFDTIDGLMVGGDWFPAEINSLPNQPAWQQEIGAIKPVGWTRMLHAAGLIKMSGAKSVLTPKGRRAVGQPAWDVIRAIWWSWLGNKVYDEFHRIDIIKGQSIRGALTAKVERRAAMVEALKNCPAGEWISFDGFSRYMRADDLMFEVSNDPWKLYISDRQYGALGYSDYAPWEVLQDRFLLCVLMEYAATLGLVDIAYELPDRARPVDNWGMDDYIWLSRYDGLQAFCINPLGAFVLGDGTATFTPSSAPMSEVRLVVQRSQIIVDSGSPSPVELVQLETWTKDVGNEVYRLDRSRAIEAIETGQEPDDFRKFLEARSDGPLPEAVITFLEEVSVNARAVCQSGGAILFECRNADTADLICGSKELSTICLRAGKKTLAVRESGIAKFRKQVRELGLGIQ